MLSYSTSTDGLRGLTRTFALLPLRLCEQAGRVLQGIRVVRNPSPGKRAQIGGEIRRGAADRGEYRQPAGATGGSTLPKALLLLVTPGHRQPSCRGPCKRPS